MASISVFVDRLTEREMFRFMLKMSLGVQHLHRFNLLHRDIALRNFLLGDPEGIEIVIADFGLAGELRSGVCYF